MVTNEAIIIMKIGILKFEGIIFLREETIKLEKTKTKVEAKPIPRPL